MWRSRISHSLSLLLLGHWILGLLDIGYSESPLTPDACPLIPPHLFGGAASRTIAPLVSLRIRMANLLTESISSVFSEV